LTGTAISLTGATNINTTGSYNTSVGNTTGIVTIAGSAVNVGTNSGSSVTLGSNTGNSTVSLNGNRLQNVGAGVAGTDAVNLNQVNSLMSSTTSQITSLQNQANTNKSGISGVSAMANIPSLSASQKNNFGVGIGAFQGSSAIAFGGNFRIKDNLVGKISASLSSGNYVTGAGLSFGW
jgi:autotransporter adhesin